MGRGSEATELDVELRWTPVLAAAGKPYRFPQKTTKYLRRTYQGPAVYCWRIERPKLASVVYVGETDCVIRRLRGFLWPGTQGETNLRLNSLFRALLAEKAAITFELLSFDPFLINRYEVSMERLGNPYLRRLVESVAILTEAKMGSLVLNRGKELVDRYKARLFPVVRSMEAGERERFLRFLSKSLKKTEL